MDSLYTFRTVKLNGEIINGEYYPSVGIDIAKFPRPRNQADIAKQTNVNCLTGMPVTRVLSVFCPLDRSICYDIHERLRNAESSDWLAVWSLSNFAFS